jgi:hypothetical protein
MELSSGGVLVEVRDDGVGVSPSRLTDMNWRLDHPPVVDVSISRHMGLYAVSRLAARHGIRVKLRPGTPQGLSALVWLPGTLAKREQAPAANGHFRSFGAEATGPLTAIRSASGRYMSGRHRTGLSSSGGQPLATGQPPQPPQPAQGGQRGQAGQSATAWFAAKRPSSGAAISGEELAVGWRSAAAAGNGGPGGGAVADHAGLTTSGLPRRVARTSGGSAGSDTPASAVPFAAHGPVLAAPLDGTAPQGVPYQEAAQQGQVPSRRRSPEAVRSRVSGFQLGGRDAVQAGHPMGRAPLAGEENSR